MNDLYDKPECIVLISVYSTIWCVTPIVCQYFLIQNIFLMFVKCKIICNKSVESYGQKENFALTTSVECSALVTSHQ